MKANVYIPPHLIIEQPDCKRPIAAIVQAVIETIGIPTVKRWREAALGMGWSLSQKGHVSTPSEHFPYLIPPPVNPGSASYIFRGRKYGSLPLLIPSPEDSSTTSFHTSSASSSTAFDTSIPSTSDDIYFPDELSPVELALVNATEKMAYLEEHLEQANQKEEEYLAQIRDLRNELAETMSNLKKREYVPFSPTSPSRQARQVSPKTPHATTSLHFPKVNVSMFPRPSPARFQSNVSAPDLLPAASCSPVTPKAKQKGKAETIVLSKLGPATMECLTTFNLTHLTEMVDLIVRYNLPPLWAVRLATLSISDSVRDNLLVALAEDWEAEMTK